MSLTITSMIALLAVWMLAIGWTGYHKRFARFAALVLVGLGVNMLWITAGLKAHPLDPNALLAEASLLLYAVFAFGIGWLAGRLARQLQASRVE
ncbi:hypothetical protein [uncultured Sulfitobacter sp.]|uniref:hypothetical protein n=1 Tax=uncultured Sulfitobacter sp. TaxID=191468 RepID=UPI00262F89EE|nr:hypothetical protein [uncultured Sulfitobacter sp.]